MHVYTLMIAPSVGDNPDQMAAKLSAGLIGEGFDWWTVGGRFAGLFDEISRTTSDQGWPDAISVCDLPDLLPNALNPPGLLTPNAPYLWRPLQPSRRAAWDRRLGRIMDGYRYGYTAVILDAHC